MGPAVSGLRTDGVREALFCILNLEEETEQHQQQADQSVGPEAVGF
jgi:hypothetical protein